MKIKLKIVITWLRSFNCTQAIRWFSRFVIAAMLVDENKRFLISSFCSSTSRCRIPCHSKTHLESAATWLRGYGATGLEANLGAFIHCAYFSTWKKVRYTRI